MIKKEYIILVLIIFSAVFLSGCQEPPTDMNPTFDNIELESDIVELSYGKVTSYKENNIVIRIEVEYRLKNIADKRLNLRVAGEFYDKENNLLNISNYKEIDFPMNYEEKLVNTLSYSGDFVSQVGYVRLLVEERT